MKMSRDSDLRALLTLLQISGLAPFRIGNDRKSSKKSFVLCSYNLAFASFVMYNMIWAENDTRNNVDYPNKSFLIGIAFDTVDVLENIHICFVTLRSIIFTNVGLSVWFKMKQVNRKLKDLNVKFDVRRFRRFIYLTAGALVLLSVLLLAVDIILCSRLNIYYTVNYWVLCIIPLIQNSIVEVSYGGFSLFLYQRFWAINEFLVRATDLKEMSTGKSWQQKNPFKGENFSENILTIEKAVKKYCRIRVNNSTKHQVRPSDILIKKKSPTLVMIKSHDYPPKYIDIETIRTLKILYFDLFEISTDLNSIFGWSALFIFAISFFGCTINMYFVIVFHLRSYEAEQYVSCFLWMTAYLFKVFFLIVFSTTVSKEAKRTTDLLHIMLNQTEMSDIQLQSELKTFCLQNNQCKVKFKAAEFFTINHSLLFQFIAGVLSNVVFVVQFDKINFSKK